MTMTVNGMNITVTVTNAEEAFLTYHAFSRYGMTINGTDLQPTGNGFAGYTRGYFSKFFEKN
jgi:hypothetical protein